MAKPYLPQDMVEEILLRLPVKSLLRFTLVSKPWGCLISSSLFSKLHLQLAKEDPRIRTQNLLILGLDRDLKLPEDCGTLLSEEAALVSLDFPAREPHQHVEILGSCNGLVALISVMNLSVTKNLFIWNPSTRDYKKLPEHRLPSVYSLHRYFYGLGYDSTSDDYKLLFGREASPNFPIINSAIFSLRKNSWRTIENPPSHHNYGHTQPGVFVNGALHWPIREKKPLARREISAFDLNREKFHVLSVPHDCIDLAVLGVVKDKLCIIFPDSSLSATEFWVMEDYGNEGSWTELLRIKTNLFGSRYRFLEVFYIFESHVLYKDKYVSNQLKRYDVQEENIKEFRVAGGYDFPGYRAMAYKESLLSPNFYCNPSTDEQNWDYRIREMKHTLPKNGNPLGNNVVSNVLKFD
ncbi:hypothetical protein PTKIN_Ptkin09bG0032800 [Pterospermum kingtungense]